MKFARRAKILTVSSPALASPDNPKPRIPSLLRQRGRVQFPAGTLKRRVARNVAVATSRASGAQHLAAWLQPADGDHKSPLAANGDLNFARRAAILTVSSTKRKRVAPGERAIQDGPFKTGHSARPT